MSREEIENKLKLVKCYRCGHEESVRYKDSNKKFCSKCAKSESIFEMMHMVPIVGLKGTFWSLESQYQDWIDKDGRRQETLSRG